MKLAIFGDIHFGKRDDRYFNKDCETYIIWFLEQCKEHNIDRIIFLGDWFDNRFKIDNQTHSIADKCLRRLSCDYEVDMLVGNHDMLYINNRSVHSLECYKDWHNVTVYDTITSKGDFTYVPFLLDSESDIVEDISTRYIFGHFEFPTFLTNRYREHPEKEDSVKMEYVKGPELLLTGHFHIRQSKTNKHGTTISYIGSPFPADYNDIDDKKRGMALLDTDNAEVVYIDWQEAPYYTRMSIDEVLDVIDEGKPFKNYVVETTIDNDILTPADIFDLKDSTSDLFREFRLKILNKEMDEAELDIDHSKSIEDLVIEQLNSIDSRDTIVPSNLVELFKKCETMSSTELKDQLFKVSLE